MKRAVTFGLVASLIVGLMVSPPPAAAHPGGTDGNGCHTCRTNCSERWGIPYGYYHRHNPVRDCFAAAAPPPPPPTPQPTAILRTPEPTPTFSEANSTALEAPVAARITATGGEGVSDRRDCSIDARTGNPGHPEGAEVTIEHEGTGPCAGWSIVSDGSRETWVQDAYLVTLETPTPPPAEVAITATSTLTAAPRSETTQSPSTSSRDAESGEDDEGSALGGGVLLLGGGAAGYWLYRRSRRARG